MQRFCMKNKNLIFLHGFPFNSSSWDSQVEHFKKTHTVLAPDLRGHRNGPSEDGPWMMAHFAEDLKQLMIDHKMDQAVICGLSMGGYIALHFAKQYPNMVAGLVLCDTQADADSNEAKDKRFATIQKIQKDGLNAFAQDFSKNVLSENTLVQKPEIQKKVISMITENKLQDVVMNVGALASRRDSNPYLADFNFPTLVLVGAEDKVTPVAVSQKLAAGIKNSTLKTIEKAGHLSNLEQPDIFNGYLEDFLQG